MNEGASGGRSHSEHPEIVDDILDVVERWFQEGG